MNGFVQRLKQLHLWLGLLLSGLLFLIIFSGSLSFYRAELDSLPLLQQQNGGADPVKSNKTAATSRQQSASMALTFLAQHAPVASQWYIELPDQRKEYLTLHWLQPAAGGNGPGQLYQQLLAAKDGTPLTTALPIRFGATDHQLGGLFFQLHFNLLQLFGPASRSIVAYAALLWLLLSIAGVSSLRGRWRSLWQLRAPQATTPSSLKSARLLRHNQLAVLTLPFALLFASSGWLTQMFSDNNAPQRQLYPAQPYQFYAELFPPTQPFAGQRQDVPAILPDLAVMLAQAEQQLALPVGKISVTQPGTAQSTVLFTGSPAAQVSNHLPTMLFRVDGTSWLPAEAGSATAAAQTSQTTIARSRSFWYGLHQSLYASPWLRALLFVSGMLCCWMIWLGLRSWLQRQPSLFWRQWVLPLTTITGTSFAVASGLLVVLQLLPISLFVGWSLAQQLLGLMSGSALLFGVLGWRRLTAQTG
ncbi:MAG: PepSY domain-containing protein [Gammaproteobacteria bacterium]|nr:PepSY domain-containing protein [Gammaproteobacteria bacterium]